MQKSLTVWKNNATFASDFKMEGVAPPPTLLPHTGIKAPQP